MNFNGLTRKLENTETEKIRTLPDGDVQLGNEIYGGNLINDFIKYKIGKSPSSYSLLDRASVLNKIKSKRTVNINNHIIIINILLPPYTQTSCSPVLISRNEQSILFLFHPKS